MARIRVNAAKGMRGTHVGKDGSIIHVDHAGHDRAKSFVANHADVPDLVARGLIDDPGPLTVHFDEDETLDENEAIAARAKATAGHKGDTGPLSTIANTAFPAGHESERDEAGLSEDDPDAPPAKRGGKAKAEKTEG